MTARGHANRCLPHDLCATITAIGRGVIAHVRVPFCVSSSPIDSSWSREDEVIERFQGDEGRRRLIDALCRQKLVAGDKALATSLSDVGTLAEFGIGATIISQGRTDNELYLLLAGTTDVIVNDRVVASENAGSYVGEMALIDPSAVRCANVVATQTVVACVVPEKDFAELARGAPELWRHLAIELADRLRQRNALVIPPNPRPHVFIGSSVESLPVARAIQLGLEHDDVTVKVWTDRVFGASAFTMEALENEIRSADFGLLVLAPDDKILARGTVEEAPRDNVVFELGMCMGALTRVRTFFVYPRGVEIRIPTDLLGLTPITYSVGAEVVLQSVCKMPDCFGGYLVSWILSWSPW